MNEHPMKYVSMIDRLLKEDIPDKQHTYLEFVQKELIRVAKEEAVAYGRFKDTLKELAPMNELAAKFNDDTYLDLT